MSTEIDHAALVTATWSRRMTIRLADGREHGARIKGKRLRPVCGDRVRARPIPDETDWLIDEVLPRDNALTRPSSRGEPEVLAANLTFLCVVAAGVPEPDWFVVDRYLCAADLMGIGAAVIYNKADLDAGDASRIEAVADYEAIGYPTLRCSAATGQNVDKLARLLTGQVAIIAGQSGVGKSSLINRLVEGAALRTSPVSPATGGRHTTVNSVMLSLPGGGAVIDSPGVRDYAPATDTAEQVLAGFREISDHAQGCRFANCRHLREPGCAVKAAAAAGSISPRRYESYRRMLSLTRKLADRRSP